MRILYICDELTDNNVLGVSQDDGIIVQCISPCFLQTESKKQTNGPIYKRRSALGSQHKLPGSTSQKLFL